MGIWEKCPRKIDPIYLENYRIPKIDRHGQRGILRAEFKDGSVQYFQFDYSVRGDPQTECTIYSKFEDTYSVIRRQIADKVDTRQNLIFDVTIVTQDGRITRETNRAAEIDSTAYRLNLYSSKCELCKDIFNIASVLTCDVGVTAICAALTGGTLLPACPLIAGLICHYISKYGVSAGADVACRKLKLCP